MRAWNVATAREGEAIAARNAEAEQRKLATAARDAESVERKKAEQSERAVYWNLYVARQYPIIDAWKDGSFGLLNRRLDDLVPPDDQPDFRGWEYMYFRDQCHESFRPLSNSASCIAWNHVANEVAIVDRKGVFEFWSPEDWALLRTLTTQRGRISDCMVARRCYAGMRIRERHSACAFGQNRRAIAETGLIQKANMLLKLEPRCRICGRRISERGG